MSPPAPARELRAASSAQSDPAPALRRAALLLHAMPERDRAWLLGQLSEGERRTLSALLVELSRLGMPSDRRVLDEALAAPPPVPARPVEDDRSEPLTRVREAEASRLVAALREEPPVLVARLLRIADWPWRRALLTELGGVARRQIEQALSEDHAPVGEALRVALLEGVARRLDGAAGARRARGWSRWFRRDRG